MYLKKVSVSLIITVLFILSCKNPVDDSGNNNNYTASDIANQTLQGKMEGISWTFQSGMAECVFSDTMLSFSLYDTMIATDTICDIFYMPDREVMFSIKKQVGEYQLGFGGATMQSVTLYNGTNIICTEGIVKINSITDSIVDVGVVAKYDGNTYVNGKFIATYCP